MQQQVKRPFGVTVIVFVQVFSFLLYVGAAISVYMMESPIGPTLIPGSESYRVASLSLEIASIVLAFGLWRMRRWAWLLIMIRLGLDMSLDLAAYLSSNPNYVSMFLNAIMVFYLNQREVQRAFETPVRHQTAQDAS